MVQEMQSATRQLCHSQLSWFRSEPAFRWVDATPAPQDVAAAIAAEVASSSPLVGTSPHASHTLRHPRRNALLVVSHKHCLRTATLGMQVRGNAMLLPAKQTSHGACVNPQS